MEKKTVFVYESVWENGLKFEGGVSVRVFSEKENAIKALKEEENEIKECFIRYYNESETTIDETDTWIEISGGDYDDCWTGNVYKKEIE